MDKKIFVVLGAILFFFPGQVPAEDRKIDYSSPFVYPAYSKKISMDFQDASLVDVLKVFSKQTSLNMISSESLVNKKITIYLENVPLQEALDQLLRANNLTYEVQPGSDIYIVKPLPVARQEYMTRVYTLKHAMVSNAKLRNTININRADGGAINSSGGSGDKTGITAAVAAILTEKGKVVEDTRTNSLIVTDIATNFPAIEKTIDRLDVAVPQILIEVEMLEVGKGTAEKIGIKVGDTPLAFSGAQRKTLIPWDQNRILAKGATWEDDVEYVSGLIDASGLTATLQFLRTQTDTKNLARPRLLTLNNEPAQIKISTQEAIGVKTQTSSSQSIATNSIEAERVETGVMLTVTPQADFETGDIVMAVVPRVIQAKTGGTYNNVTFKDPEESGSQSILRVKTGETIVIGGLIRTDVSNTVTKVPFLGDIPLIGQAFRHKNESVSERELIIFITPHILSEKAGIKNPVIAPARLIREQEMPSSRLKTAETALTQQEKK